MRILSLILAAALVAGAFPSRSLAAPEPAAPSHHEHHAGPGIQSLDVYASGSTLHLFVAEARDGNARPVLLHRRSQDGGKTWSPPVQVDAGLPAAHSPHRGSDAQVAAVGDDVVTAWMSKGTGYFDAGPMITAISHDGGKTWQPGPNPADDHSTTGHGYIDIAADDHGAFHLTWLDSRDGKQGVRCARSTDAGKSWSPNQTLKAASCECCSNAFAVGRDGAVAVLFRDGNPRDMNLALSTDGGSHWLKPVSVGAFDWQFNGCPHQGGGLAFGPSALHAVVWTGAPERVGVHYLSSSDRGLTWSQPHPLGGPTASHPDVATAADRRVTAVWDAPSGESPAIWFSESKDGGASWCEPAQLSKNGATATHPRVVGTSSGFRAFWTESAAEGPTTWQSAAIP